MNPTRIFLMMLMTAVIGVSACSDDEDDPVDPNQQKATVMVELTDAPAEYEEVNITFSEVAVHHDVEGWIVLRGDPISVDLLEWNNGNSIEIGRGEVDAGRVTQIRLMVSDADVVVDGQTHDLDIPSGYQTGLKLITNFALEAGTSSTLMLDFDAHHSIVTTGPPDNPNGYKLKPTIRAVEVEATGSISGSVVNVGDNAVATVTEADVVVTSTPVKADGTFTLAYLEPGTYTIEIVNALDLSVVVEDVEVVAGQNTEVGALVLI